MSDYGIMFDVKGSPAYKQQYKDGRIVPTKDAEAWIEEIKTAAEQAVAPYGDKWQMFEGDVIVMCYFAVDRKGKIPVEMLDSMAEYVANAMVGIIFKSTDQIAKISHERRFNPVRPGVNVWVDPHVVSSHV